jgi:hypothetical protein
MFFLGPFMPQSREELAGADSLKVDAQMCFVAKTLAGASSGVTAGLFRGI